MRTNGAAKILFLALALSLLLVACNGETEPELTTTSSVVGSTTAPGSNSTTTSSGALDDGTTTTTLVGQMVESYDVILRESTSEGETLYIVIPPGEYTSIDLENFVGLLIDSDDQLESAEVFDNEDALNAYLLDDSEQTADDLALIDEHHLISLIDGAQIQFQGPYADFGSYPIGS